VIDDPAAIDGTRMANNQHFNLYENINRNEQVQQLEQLIYKQHQPK
jgi:hypothetical protein